VCWTFVSEYIWMSERHLNTDHVSLYFTTVTSTSKPTPWERWYNGAIGGNIHRDGGHATVMSMIVIVIVIFLLIERCGQLAPPESSLGHYHRTGSSIYCAEMSQI
jgi:hypothetical protein